MARKIDVFTMPRMGPWISGDDTFSSGFSYFFQKVSFCGHRMKLFGKKFVFPKENVSSPEIQGAIRRRPMGRHLGPSKKSCGVKWKFPEDGETQGVGALNKDSFRPGLRIEDRGLRIED